MVSQLKPLSLISPVSKLPTNGYTVAARGRQISTRGGVSVSFLPTRQVLADRIVYHHDNGLDLLYALVTCCHGQEKAESGYITLAHGEDFTIGWNCELAHKLFKIPRVAIGVSLAYEDETPTDRAKRHADHFSFLARNTKGSEILGNTGKY